MSKSLSFFDKFTNFLEDTLMPLGAKIAGQRHLKAIRDGMVSATPLTLLGGLVLIISSPPVDLETIQPTNFFYRFLISWKEFSMAYSDVLRVPFRMTLGLMAIAIVLGIANSLANHYKIDSIGTSVTALITFLVVSAPTEFAVLTEVITDDMVGSTVLENQSVVLPVNYLGAEGIFTAIVIALLTTELSRFLREKGFVIKMPESVPPAIMASFENIIPLGVSVISFYLLSLLAQTATNMLIPELVMEGLSPFVGAVDSLGGIILISIITQLLWLVGLHGSSIVSGAVGVFEAGNLSTNGELVAIGESPAHIYTTSFRAFFMIIGGAGATLGLVLLFLMSKSSQLKSLGRLAIVPSLFNINEPIIFGTPLVLNPVLAIPFIVIQIVNGIITYGFMHFDFVGKPFANVPWTTPAPIGAFLTTLDFRAFFLVLALLALNMLIWYPFFKVYEKQLIMEETVKVPTE